MVPVTRSGRARLASLPLGSRQKHVRTISIAWQLAKLDLYRRYTKTFLGMAWATVSPLCMAVVIGTVFGTLFGVSLTSFLPYLFANLTLWAFLTASLDQGSICFVAAEGYIKQIARVSPFAYPLRMTFAAFVTLVFGLGAVAVVAVAFGVRPTAAWLWVLPGLAAWVVFGFCVACLAGLVNTAVRDFQHIQSVAVQALFYATPVMYPPELLVAHGLRRLLTFNPVYHLLVLVRVPLLQNDRPPLAHYVAVAATLAVLLWATRRAMRSARPHLVFWL